MGPHHRLHRYDRNICKQHNSFLFCLPRIVHFLFMSLGSTSLEDNEVPKYGTESCSPEEVEDPSKKKLRFLLDFGDFCFCEELSFFDPCLNVWPTTSNRCKGLRTFAPDWGLDASIFLHS
ncbi:hypothetical protein Ddye_016524 [Dipteronia dyeriana]|uniref:Uncharacterized protein n=1 Tax=Dipteronia dyeriana TaxID=168575 RepID=A0AAD9X0J4_9ROSI|nr:hypothetical protein Ddye_016524 [Dipteronia dyeriana]